MESAQLELLREEIEKTFGRKVLTSADCYQLGTEISQRTHHRVSFNTLRRYFHLMKDKHVPSFYTLDVLANYCGFSTFHDFVLFKRNHLNDEPEKSDGELVNYLIMLFRNMHLDNSHNVTYFSFVKHTISYLEKHLNIIDAFQSGISKTENGQNYYFEQFINIDRLDGFYGDGLRYYLIEKTTPQAQIFGYSLLCLRAWLTENNLALKPYLSKLFKFKLDNSMDANICGRFFATQLYFAKELSLTYEKVINEAKQYYLYIPVTDHACSSYHCFECVFAEALIYTEQYEEALFYIEEIQGKVKNSIPSIIDLALLETILLFKAIVYTKMGNMILAKEAFESVNPSKFFFQAKQYLSILYLSLSRVLKPKSSVDEQINYLVGETGFTRLKTLWVKKAPLKVRQ